MSLLRIVKKFRMILSSHQKMRIFELTVLMVIGGLLETCSVSLMLPFMEAVMSPVEVMQKPYVQWFCNLLGLQIPQTFLAATAIALAALFLFKNVYLLLEFNVQYHFVYGNMLLMQRRLLNGLLHRPYEFFLKASSGELLRVINEDTTQTFQLLLTVLNLFTELVVSGMLILTIFMIAPTVSLIVAFTLLAMFLLINHFIKPVLQRTGVAHQQAAAGQYRWLLQSIQGIKEVKVMAKEEFFEDNFGKHGTVFVDTQRKHLILSLVPRFLIEAISMGAMFLVIGFLIYRGSDLEVIVPMLSVIAMAAIRLLPSVNRISAAMASIAYNEPMVDKLIENLKDISGEETVSLAMDVSYRDEYLGHGAVPQLAGKLAFSGITYRYPGAEQDVLENASMELTRGESVGIVGASGAGKTTAVDVMLGLLRPREGQVLVDGVDIRENLEDWLAQIGYIPQMIFMLDDSIRANVAFGVPEEELSDEQVWRALREASLDTFVRDLPEGLDTQIGERGIRLSGGQRQRIGIARALYPNPEVLIFDEATSALDNETEAAIMESINGLHGHKTMLIIAHRLTTIEGCDHVYRVSEGKITKER